MLPTPHPAIELIFLISLVIINLMPLMAWLLLRSERDGPCKLWFLGTHIPETVFERQEYGRCLPVQSNRAFR
ncbi:MAG: hypothetical protein EBQ86_01625 [Betaproteobacteria bacterium]|nr:hypothetical protein [Betaproteobacteria bacterium]NBX88783.1 hypothetical protein [Betaproteobacteria bacterium]